MRKVEFMAGSKSENIGLSDGGRQALERLVAGPTTGQQQAQRARIVLKAAEGKPHTAIAKALKIWVDMARLWRGRWIEVQGVALEDLSVEERLEDLLGSGAPGRLRAAQICQMEQMACQAPEKAGRPISQRTGRQIADELVKGGIVERISARHAARLLKKGVSNGTGCATI
jgi:putative transposase